MANQDVNSNETVFDPPVGITNPPIDELLTKVSSKYALVIFAAKRARQINDYFQTVDEGVFEFVAIGYPRRSRKAPVHRFAGDQQGSAGTYRRLDKLGYPV